MLKVKMVRAISQWGIEAKVNRTIQNLAEKGYTVGDVKYTVLNNMFWNPKDYRAMVYYEIPFKSHKRKVTYSFLLKKSAILTYKVTIYSYNKLSKFIYFLINKYHHDNKTTGNL